MPGTRRRTRGAPRAGARPREGLALLEEALAADPGLPFTGRALGQAHLLIAKELAAALDFEHALESGANGKMRRCNRGRSR